MVEPVILSADILTQARLWRDDCLRRWNEAGQLPPPRIGEAIFTSPVDGSQRRVVLDLYPLILGGVRGKTRPGVLEADETETEGYTIALNASMINPALDSLLAIILHELTHALDPECDKDIQMQNPATGIRVILSSMQQYDLASERRAFSAMWTADLAQDILDGTYHDPDDAITRYCLRATEFAAFVQYTHHLHQERLEHFSKIVDALKSRGC